MKKTDRKKMTDYWRETAAHDYETMRALFKSKRYDASLFFGHLVLEKVLKGLVIEYAERDAPRTHDLLYLAKLSGIALLSEDMDILDEANEFNMETRYPEWKMEFYKRCTKQYTTKHIELIKNIYKKLCKNFKQKK